MYLNDYNYHKNLFLSRIMRKPTTCICENKAIDQLRSNLISTFVFTTRIVQFLFFLNPKFPASGHLLCLYSLVCVGPVQKPHCWFSRDAAHLPNMHLNKACDEQQYCYMSRLLGKPTWFLNRSDTSRPVQAQKRARSLKFWI